MPPVAMLPLRTCLAVALVLLAVSRAAQAGTNADTVFTERATTDFDTFLQLLNPYGTWSKIGDKWAYTPTDRGAPYTHGRWLYTDYGWYWKGALPHSWATEHYGYWKLAANGTWSWFPAPSWLGETIEMRATPGYVGWRSAEVDDNGSFVEAPVDRYSKSGEWSFVTLAHFANPITPASLAKPDIASAQLEDSTDSRHSYQTYRAIERPGPHPADIAPLSVESGMLAPGGEAHSAPNSGSGTPATHPPPATAEAPAFPDSDSDLPLDSRQVKYWVTMNLPTFWTRPPADAHRDQLYIYKPDLYQDQDGIERRITLWFNPHARTSLKDVLAGSGPPRAASTPAATDGDSNAPATAAVPVLPDAAPGSNPFSSPLDRAYQPPPASLPATNSSSKTPAPSGLK